MPEPCIPERIWRRLEAFLRDGKTGQITLYVKRGVVIDAALEERIRAHDVIDSPRP
jgi:hypothetical protein